MCYSIVLIPHLDTKVKQFYPYWRNRMNEAVRDEPLEQYIEAMKELWAYEPFQLLLTTFKDRVPNINSVEQTRTVEELFFRSGQMDIIRTLENLQDNIGIIETDYLQSLEPQDYTVASGLYSS